MSVLNPEERKKRFANKQALKKKLAEEKIIRLKYDYLTREVKFGQLTIKQHQKNWKKMLLNITLPQMKKDLKFAWQNFERVIDAKDFAISILIQDTNDAEDQYAVNLKGHSENIDKLITIFDDRLMALKKENEKTVNLLKISAENKNREINSTFAENELYLKTMLFGLEMAKKEQEQRVREEYLSKIDEETDKYNYIMQHLRAGLEKTCSDFWDNTKTFLNQYIANTKEKRKKYKILAERDTAINELCAKRRIQLENMRETLSKLRIKFDSVHKEQELKISDLLQERQYFADAFWTLKTRLETDKNLDNANLAFLTANSCKIIERFKKIFKKGKNLLELASICRKFETEKEKVLPFPLKMTPDECKTIDADIKLDEYKDIADLRFFWHRVAQADATRYGINEEREHLRRENKILKQKIHEYCACLNCSYLNQNYLSKSKRPPGWIHITDGDVIQKMYQKYYK